jgi:hypothetical protein
MMYLITLDNRSQNSVVREKIEAEIKQLGNWSNRLGDTWFLECPTLGARQIRDLLRQHLDNGDAAKGRPFDRLFVARISRNWAGANMGQGFPEWIGRRDFGKFENG